ncbi:SWIM zinc finger family protein [Streptomyces sp. GbtcB7]|uniref:SWIM zinc finger family protein n=1 Tax=Streptomyces sp. GbtcB7 TaxID=2824752 RepID=UPI001C2FDE61|nr:SWIM zinc finger family protein [Streptomyces sp. GbtcB7]
MDVPDAEPSAPAAGPRPADVARRALRAARERDTRGAAAGDEPGSRSDGVTSPAARPGDAAREALRRAATTATRGSGPHPHPHPDPGPGADTVPDPETASGAGPGPVRPSARAETADAPSADVPVAGTRPGDIAREALRAARTEARQARTAAETKGAGSAHRSADRAADRAAAGARVRRDRRDQDRGGRVRDVREVLAEAFELPGAEAPRETTASGRSGHPDTDTKTDVETNTETASDANSDTKTDAETDAEKGHRRSAHPEHSEHPRLSTQPRLSEASTFPSAAAVPRSMASPRRDGELRRTFEALPARTSHADTFAETWWGNAWVSALEEGALDAARLARGRAYADQGHVDAITVTPGLVLAYVHGSRPRPYRVQVRLRTLDDGDWDRFLDAAAERPGHIAALLDKEMPKSLADCGADLLPGPGDLAPQCSCPDHGHPCKHAAALCYQTARLLDEDPFVLLLLRGRGERELLDALSRRNATRAARAAQEQQSAPLPGVRARDALARRALPPLPAPLPAPAHPEQPPTYPGAPGGPDPFALDQLATDAAARAHALLTTGRDPVAELTLWQDAVRLAAARPGSGLTGATRALYSSLASVAGRTPADLARAVAAWRQGGLEGLTVLEEPWDPPAGRFDRARPLLLAADLPAFRPWRNQLTHPRGHAQLRLGHDGLWYAYESEPGREDWWPRGTPDLDPVGALTGLGAPGEL